MDSMQNQNPQENATPTPTPLENAPREMPETTPGAHETQWGPIIGIIIIIGLLVIGGVYYWKEKGPALNSTSGPSADEIRAEQDSVSTAFGVQSESSALSAIEADLNATNLEGIDAEAGKADLELQ